MTGTYDWNPMPHKVDIKCPDCGEHCVFEFGEVVKIKFKKDVPFFEQSDVFEYAVFTDSSGHKWHGAIYFANLHGGSIDAINSLPDGYSPKNWAHSKYLIRNHNLDLGAVSCSHCHTRKPYILRWPEDAYYSISYKGEALWAFNRESAVDLRDYIKSNERKTEKYKWAKFLMHIPTVFKKQNARSNIVKQLNKVLA
ncbi:hypothetical protein J6I90_00965 [Pseudidiomarina sp. 1APP75-32.1]|uniref:Uncharacterized protein n=1 Tax=Pseudidiomarina terrestris TaxID=2820060 RepID=A0AAW7QU90_9GAMM|nr:MULTISPECIES: hypothetical protein [unclassified Pseudidiomarina]MDN7123448.1 hypothetical protein [Pseudidiomarina sp. 1APP75-32.1]MDN7128827.1 hypothetical protein [Pseudidiomarina sp. 1APR75-15]